MRITSYLKVGVLCYLFLFQIVHQVFAEPLKVQEHHLKARYIDGFTAFIQWPMETFANKEELLRLCVLGENPFGKALDILVDAHNNRSTRQSNPRVADYLRRGADLSRCHLLYISKSEESYVAQILAQVRGKPILTISSLENFAVNGGMIQFYLRNNKVRFLIDPQTIRNERLQPDANLLRIADLVGD